MPLKLDNPEIYSTNSYSDEKTDKTDFHEMKISSPHYTLYFSGNEMIVHLSISNFNFLTDKFSNEYLTILYFFPLAVISEPSTSDTLHEDHCQI